jgi:hypothetical protein
MNSREEDQSMAEVYPNGYVDALVRERDAALRLVAQLQAECQRWQDNCTGQHGSQMPCGIRTVLMNGTGSPNSGDEKHETPSR